MRKFAVPLFILGCAALMPVKGFAFTSISRTTSTAVAPLTGAGQVAMDIILKNLSDNSTTTQVYWSGVTLPVASPGYVQARAYIQLNSTMTAAGGGIQIYTDNTASDANPKFTSAVTSGQVGSDPAGLVDTTTTTKTLAMAWTIKANVLTSTGAVVADPTKNCSAVGIDPNADQWLFFKDRVTPTIANSGNVCSGSGVTAFGDGQAFIAVKQAGNGIHFGQADNEFGAALSPNFIYVEANFNNAVTPRTYKTTTLRLEAYTQ